MPGPSDDLVIILDRETGDMVGECGGPAADGTCPAVTAGDVVPCAGQRIAPANGSRHTGWRLHVPYGSDRCPLGWIFESDL